MGEPNRYVIKDRDQSSVGEAFRALRASIMAAQSDGDIKTLLFTSASVGDGKSFVVANTAAMLAYAGKQVILIDCDLRKPVLRDVFGLQNIGLTNIVDQGRPVEETIQLSGIPNLKVLTSGPMRKEPSELLSDEIVKLLIEYLKTKFDYVIIDSPPLVVVSDACILASKVDGVLLVIDAKAVHAETAKKAMDLLIGARANIIGAILNDVESDKDFFSNGLAR